MAARSSTEEKERLYEGPFLCFDSLSVLRTFEVDLATIPCGGTAGLVPELRIVPT